MYWCHYCGLSIYWRLYSSVLEIAVCKVKVKVIPQQAEVVQGVPVMLRPRIVDVRHYEGGRSSAIRTGRLCPRRNPWYSLPEAESTSGHRFCRGYHGKKSPVTPPGIDPGTVRLVAQCLNHYATPGPNRNEYQEYFLGDKGGRCIGLTILPHSCADCLEIWEPPPPGNLRACPGL